MRKLRIVLAVLLIVVVLILAVFRVRRMFYHPKTVETRPVPTETVPETEPVVETTVETTVETEPTEPPYNLEENTFVLTFVGDCTLGSDTRMYGSPYSFIGTIGEDYDYPFRNVAQFFRDDDLTIVNLEGVLKDSGYAAKEKGFSFRGPTAYTQILSGSSVEAVTLDNNHIYDYGVAGVESTRTALEEAEIAYVERDDWKVITTERGLKIGLYGAFFTVDMEKLSTAIAEMEQEGAELIVMAIHWGGEGYYRPIPDQEVLAHKIIDAGVDIIYGSHPHVLQKVETYGDGIIYYSLANFCFGGNHYPPDLDTAILRQQVIREEDGHVRLGELTCIPASVSSIPKQNNFQPTPYEEGTEEYERAMSKLDGTYSGYNLAVNYGW